MEPWQQALIKANLPSLLATNCSAEFLSYFTAEDLLSDEEVDEINAKFTKSAKAQLFYATLNTKTEGFPTLNQALKQTKQSGVIQSLCTIPISRLNKIHIRVLGTTKPLKEVLDTDQKKNIQEWTKKNLKLENDNKLFETIFQQNPVLDLVHNTIPSNDEHYIQRFLSRRNGIDPTIFEKDCPDVFVFNGAKSQEIREFNPTFEIESSTRQLVSPKLTVRFIKLDDETHWEKICVRTKYPVHLIKFEDETKTFALEKTSCFSDLLQQHLKGDKETNCKVFSETDFINIALAQNVKGVCICDKPGMGKSYLLANIAKEVRQTHPERIVAFISLKNMMLPDQNEAVGCKELILQHICASKFSKEILKLIIPNDTKFELFFDGLDEVSEKMMSRITDVIKHVGRDLPKARIYVTARPVVRKTLEETTGVVAFDILPFDEKIQCSYLIRHWYEKHDTVNEGRLSEYAKFCMKTIRTSLRKSETDITGIPLLCKLVAENYCEQAGIFAAQNSKQQIQLTKHFANSLLEIYLKFMEKENMLGKTKCNFACMHQECSNNTWCNIKCQIKSFHAWQAIKLIFPGLANQLSEEVCVFPDFSDEQILSSGFLVPSKKTSSSELEFTHRTFAEFLVAEYLAKNIIFMPANETKLNANLRGLQQLTFNWLFTPVSHWAHPIDMRLNLNYVLKENVVACFLNDMILMEESNVQAFGTSKFSPPSTYISVFSYTPIATFLCCLKKNYEALIQILFKAIKNSRKPVILNIEEAFRKNEEVALEVFQTACENCRKSTVEALCYCFRETFNFDLIKLCTRHVSPIKTSIVRAEYELAIFFFQNVACRNIELLLSCLDTTDLVEEKFAETKRLEIVKRLLTEFSHLLPESWPMTLFLIGYRNKSFEFRQAIVANDQFFNKNQNTFLQIEKDFREMADYVLLKTNRQKMFADTTKFKKYFFKISSNRQIHYNLASLINILRQLNADGNVLHTLQQCIITEDKTEDSVENMIQNLQALLGSTFFSKYKKAFSFLFFASVKEGNVKVAEMLYSRDNSFLEIEYNDRTTALLLATESHEIEMVKFLASKGANIFAKDVHGCTILHVAAKIGCCNFFKSILLFLRQQADLFGEKICKLYESRTIGSLQTPLHYILKYLPDVPKETLELFLKGGTSSVEKLGDIDVGINAVDSDGNLCLHLAVLTGNKDLVQCLVDHGADCYITDKIGCDFAHLCARKPMLDLLENCDLNTLDSEGNNALQCALHNYYFRNDDFDEFIKAMVKYGADVNIKNRKGDTAYDIANLRRIPISRRTECLLQGVLFV